MWVLNGVLSILTGICKAGTISLSDYIDLKNYISSIMPESQAIAFIIDCVELIGFISMIFSNAPVVNAQGFQSLVITNTMYVLGYLFIMIANHVLNVVFEP